MCGAGTLARERRREEESAPQEISVFAKLTPTNIRL